MFTEPALCALLLGGLLIVVSILGILFLKKIHRFGERTQGHLIHFVVDSDGDRTPIIRFETNNRMVVEGKPYVYSSASFATLHFNRAKKHIPVPLLYLPESPKKFIIDNKTGFDYSTLTFFGLVGVTFLVLGILELTGVINLF